LSVVLSGVLRDARAGLALIAPIRHRRLRLLSLCTHAAFWQGTFEAAPQWHRGRRRERNLDRRERCQNAQLFESTFLTCYSRLVPLRFVLVFPCWLNFSAGPWPSLQRICLLSIPREKLTMSCCRVIFVVVSVITLPLACLCSDAL